MSARQAVYLLDASIFIFRSYFSLPDHWHNERGQALNAVYGYTRFLLATLERLQPQRMVAAFDESLGQCFRTEIYPAYKQSRSLPDDDLANQLAACRKVTECLGITSLSHNRYEADDLLASVALRMRCSGRPMVFLSRDKDLAQLIRNPHDRVWDPASDYCLDHASVQQRFGVKPRQLVDYLALVGDPVDDIPGVPGIGAKTAAALLQRFGVLDSVYAELDTVAAELRGGKRIAAALAQHQVQLSIARKLVQLNERVPLQINANALCWSRPSRDDVQACLAEIGLERSLRRRLARSPVLQ